MFEKLFNKENEMDNKNNITEIEEKALDEVNAGAASAVSIPKVLNSADLDKVSGGRCGLACNDASLLRFGALKKN